jgi:cobaltochelatase CobN
MMRITAIVWGSELPMLREAAEREGVMLNAWATFRLRDEGNLAACIASLKGSDIIVLHPTQEGYWDMLIPALQDGIPVVSFGHDPSFWKASNQPPAVVARVSSYFSCGGVTNMVNLLRYLEAAVLHRQVQFEEPSTGVWEGAYHPDAPCVFPSAEEYWAWRERRHAHAIGILFYRIYWTNRDLAAIDALIRECEREHDVIAVFSVGTGDSSAGTRDSTAIIREFFPGVDAVICLQSSALSHDPGEPARVFAQLGVPVIHPLVLYYRTDSEWMEKQDGLGSSELGWSVILPEMYGMTGMIPVATAAKDGPDGPGHDWHMPIGDRIRTLALRVGAIIRLRDKPNREKKVAFILNSSACASVEANVGAAAHLDSLESVVRILARMKEEGFSVEVPENGQELARTILDRRAINEFRWTTTDDIVARGGALGLVDQETYRKWFSELPPALRTRMAEVWGEPPGRARDGVPPAMLYQGKMVIPGLRFGNAVICTQPKRGCAGSRCDGEVCRILHDPDVPPPHHYLAVYRYLERVFGADVIVHVGTHGTLEFLPGKSIALSGECLPDAIVGTLPLLYIYNSDNPSEGTIAKRRAHATLVDHLQTVMAPTSPYGVLKELEELVGSYRKFRDTDRARAHALEHQVLDIIAREGLGSELGLEGDQDLHARFDDVLSGVDRLLSEVYTTRIPEGMHVFGTVPRGFRRAQFIVSVLDHDGHVHALVARMMGIDMRISPSESALLGILGRYSVELVEALLGGQSPESAATRVLGEKLVEKDSGGLASLQEEVMSLSRALDLSDEAGSLISGMGGKYVSPGPSGLLSRGKTDILPTGRNFYSLDPSAIPTGAAWKVGSRLAEILVEKYRNEHGSYPKNVALLWMASDIMWAEGEQMAQALALIGVEPVFERGKPERFRVIPLERLGRPRIDITVRISGILRDCFFGCVEALDDAIRAVAALNEPPEWNYLRSKDRDGIYRPRIFGAPPGTYGTGVNLAVYASAWETPTDLSDIFIYWNGQSYGRGNFGGEAREDFVRQLSTVDVTFSKVVTDEYDLLGCCCYFGSHGGMTAAAREVSGKDVAAYYGDTRNTSRVEVRTLAEEIWRVVRTKLLNPQYIEGLKEHGYAGAAELSRRTGRVFGWEATTGEVDDRIFDGIARTFLLDPENREFFREHNIWAMEEMTRRLLEANARGMWDADPAVLEKVREVYLEIEGDLEEDMGSSRGDRQGGAVTPVIPAGMKAWKEEIAHLARRKTAP